jgi:hypothetical protein
MRFRRHATTKTVVLMLVVFAAVLATYPKGGVYTDVAERPVFTTVLFVISAGFWGIPFLLATFVPTRRVGAALCGVVGSLCTLAYICISLILAVALEPASALFHFLADLQVALGATMTPAMAAWGMWDRSFTPDIRWLWIFAAAQVPIYVILGWLATHTGRAKHSEN